MVNNKNMISGTSANAEVPDHCTGAAGYISLIYAARPKNYIILRYAARSSGGAKFLFVSADITYFHMRCPYGIGKDKIKRGL